MRCNIFFTNAIGGEMRKKLLWGLGLLGVQLDLRFELKKREAIKTKIKEYRKELKMTQEELAEAVDVTRQTIIALEQGKYNPSLILAYKVTKALRKEHIEDVFVLDGEDFKY
jgi:putative transcriptional regulator